MIRKHFSDVAREKSGKDGFKGFYARYLWSKDDKCPNFAMRMMEIEPGGHTSYHSHLEEHEFYFLDGEPGYVDEKGVEIKLNPGDTLYVPADEAHQIKNLGGTTMRMICMIPILAGGDGKSPAPRPDGKDYVIEEKPSASC